MGEYSIIRIYTTVDCSEFVYWMMKFWTSHACLKTEST
jgi:hypothetical protein